MSTKSESMDDKLLIENILNCENGKIVKLTKKVLQSSDLNIVIDPEITDVHIICDTLNISGDLSKSYRAKNVLISANKIYVLEESLWDLSGRDALTVSYKNSSQNIIGEGIDGDRGINGQNGGNCEIVCDFISNSNLWTIKSNGGKGSDGGIGAPGKNGDNGRDATEDDAKSFLNKIFNTNFIKLLMNGSEVGASRKNTFYENGMEITMIYNTDSSNFEYLLLIKGTKGKPGSLGGLGGEPGKGGRAGRVNKNLKIIAQKGSDGVSGMNGFNGQNGNDGNDFFMIIQNKEIALKGENSKFKILSSNTKVINSVYYKPLNKFLYLTEIKETCEEIDSSRNNPEALMGRLNDCEQNFCKFLISVLENSNKHLNEVTRKLKIQEFINQNISSRIFANEILKNTFNIPYYDVLQNYAAFFTMRSLKNESQLKEILQSFINDSLFVTINENTIKLKVKLMTSEDLEEISSEFKQIHVICDVFHVNTKLSSMFRGRNLAIAANSIYVHDLVEWDLSGCCINGRYYRAAGQDSSGQGLDGKNGKAGENGGNFVLKCGTIENSSLWTIKSNGSDGQNGQSGGDGRKNIDGTSPTIVLGMENDLEKEIFVESPNSYMIIVRGSNGKSGMLGGKAGLGGLGGKAGNIRIEIDDCQGICEIEIIAFDGKDGKDGIPGKCPKTHYSDGKDAVLLVKNGIEKYFGLNENCKYDVCQSKHLREHSLHINEMFYYPKAIHDIEAIESRQDDLKLFDNLVYIFRNSFEKFDEVVKKLQLKELIKSRISLRDVAEIVSKNEISVPHYKQLKRVALQYVLENHQIHSFIKHKIEEFIEPIKISTSSNITEIKKKILMSSEFSTMNLDDDINELQIICDTLHINSDFTFAGKNIAVFCNFVEVHGPFCWNLSGQTEGVKKFSSDAGQNDDGSGKNGYDGYAGKSGGNFYLQCKHIENVSSLSIVSNGTDGGFGQNGGNGKDGEDGRDAALSDFYVGDIRIKMPFENYNKFIASQNVTMECTRKGLLGEFVYGRGKYISDNGLEAYFHLREGTLLALVKGKNGEKGKSGGLGGYGGEAGLAGKISINCENHTDNNKVIIFNKSGKSGAPGHNGWNGIRGSDGKDLGKFDYTLWEYAEIIGSKTRSKLKFVEETGSSVGYTVTLGLNQLSSWKIWSNDKQCYVKIEKDYDIVKPSTQKTQNNSTLSRSKMLHALAKANPSIDSNAIIQKSSDYLNESMNEISNEISRFEQKFMTVDKKSSSTVAKSSKQSEIDFNEIRDEHEAFLSNNMSEIADCFGESNSLELSMSEKHNLMEKLQLSTTRKINHDVKKKKKVKKYRKNPERDSSETINYELLRSTNAKKTSSECFEFLRKSKLDANQYQHLMKNIHNLCIQNDDLEKGINDCVSSYINPNHQIQKDFKNSDLKSQFSFMKIAFKNFMNERNINLSDVESICEEKLLQLFYRDVYKQFNVYDENNKNLEEISFDSDDFAKQFPFLKDSKEFDSNLEYLNKYFNIDSVKERKEIVKYFQAKCKKFEFSFSEAIFNYMMDNIRKFKSIAPILNEFEKNIKELDETNEEYEQDLNNYQENDTEILTAVNDSKREDFIKMLEKFYDNKKIQKSIEEEFLSHGINSPLYRKVLAYKCELKFALCRRGIDNNLRVFEWHNYGHDLRFDYGDDDINKGDNDGMMTKLRNKLSEKNPFSWLKDNGLTKKDDQNPIEEKSEVTEIENSGYFSKIYNAGKNFFRSEITNEIQQQKNSNEIFIVSEFQKFSILNFEAEKYANFKCKEEMNEKFKEIALILENIHDSSIHTEEFFESNIVEVLTGFIQKYRITSNKFANIFKNTDVISDEQFLFETVMSCFPQGSYTYTIDDFNLCEREDEKQGMLNKLQNIYQEAEDEIKTKIKWTFKLIAQIGGISVLKAITIRIFNDTCFYNLEDFMIFIKSIFTILLRKQGLTMQLTFMILANEQEFWIPETIMIKIDSILGLRDQHWRNKWKNILEKNKQSKILPIFLDKILNLERASEQEMLNLQDFDQIFENIPYIDDDSAENLSETNLNTWGLMTTDKYWNIHLDKLKQNNKSLADDFQLIKAIFEDMSNKYGLKTRKLMSILHERNREISDVDLKNFLQNFNTGIWIFGDEVLKILRSTKPNDWFYKLNKYFSSAIDICNASKIADMIKSDDETSLSVKKGFDKIKTQIDQMYVLKDPAIKKKFNEFTELEIMDWLDNFSHSVDILQTLAIIKRTFELKMGKLLRDTQLTAILTMWHSNNGILMQFSTGEGKTFIAMIFAILKVLYGEKVDIVTSSSVLAIRDATNENYLKIFEFFKIKVDHNCHPHSDRRKEAYLSKIVYGTLCNFQRDYLLTEFHEQNVMSEHHFKNILVDEVDSMLLDKGNNILYLSQDLPDLDEIESIFVFIWQWINQNFDDIEEASKIFSTDLIRKVVLDNAYGILDEDDINKMGTSADASKVMKILKDLKVIDKYNLIVEKYFDESKISSTLGHFGEELAEKITIYCREKIESEKQIKFPTYLKDFVMHHLDKWIENAIRALYLQNENQYVVDRPNTGMIEDYPDVNIIDLDTGTDMSNSQWDEGLHQFLQLKYGCKLSPLSLKSVFISNVSFFKKYDKLYGMTGTLGNQQERQKIMKIHDIDFITIPRYRTRNFIEYAPIFEVNEDNWKNKICDEVEIMLDNSRSVLIICETIQETLNIQKAIAKVVPSKSLHIYQRDSDNIDIGELPSRHVIISTNLAGRGTDICLSPDLKYNGGLHVILANLPDNSRIEEQAFGRAARSGEKGSGRLIIRSNTSLPISKLKESRNQNELKRLDEISTYYENFIKIEEDFFDKFQSAYKELKEKSPNDEAHLLNFLIQWSFWLDINSKLLEEWKRSDNRAVLQEKFDEFISNKYTLHPIMRIELFKELIGKDKKCSVWDDLNDNLQDDLFAHQYFKLYEMMRQKQIENEFNIRDLKDDEQRQIRKCYGILQSSINNRQVRIQCIKYLKENPQKNSRPNEGFENQQNEILEIYNEISKNLRSLNGDDINPESLGTALIDKEIMRKNLYEELLKQGCITPPKISRFYSKYEVIKISRKHNIDSKVLLKFLENHRSKEISSLQDFGEVLKRQLKLPSRIEFWNILLEKEILKNEVVYAIINLNDIKDIDPSAGEQLIEKNYKSEILLTSGFKLFFASTNEDQNGNKQEKLVIKMESLKTEFSKERIEYLMNNNVIEVNKEAYFDMQILDKLKNSKIFENFDEINRDDFKIICKNHEKIIEKLKNMEIIESRSSHTFRIIYENMEKLSNPYNLGGDYVYHSRIYKLLKTKFSYRIALEKLVEDVSNSNYDSIISLDMNPHVTLLNDFISNMIIEQAKVDETKIDNCTKIFKNANIKDILRQAGINGDQELIKDLKQNRLITESNQINKFDIENTKLSSRYQNIETTVKLLLQNHRILIENAGNVKNNLKAFIKPLRNKELSELEITLVPIEKFLPQNNFLHFMELKSLGVVIKVQQQLYSKAYWIRFSIVLAFAILQIAVGVAITLMSKGLALKLGSTLINEGTSDAIFALSSLKTGNFTWSDYCKHKVISVATSVVLLSGEIVFSKIKWLKKATDTSKGTTTAMGATIGGTLSETTGSQIVKEYGKVGARKVLRETAFKTVISCKNAVIQAGVGMAVDTIIKQFLNQVTEKISEEIVNIIKKDFNSHKLSSTFDKMLEFYKPEKLKKLIIEKFQQIQSNAEFYRDIASKVSSGVDTIIRSDQNTFRSVALITSLVAKTVDIGMVTYFVRGMYDDLNCSLNNVLRTKRDSDIKWSIQSDEINSFKTDVIKCIQHEAIIQYRNSLNSTVVKPVLMYAGTKITRNIVDSIEDVVKSSISKYRENKLSERTIKVVEMMEKHKTLTNSDDLPEELVKEAMEILASTKNPEIYKTLIKQNIPMDTIGIECVRIVLEKKFGEKFKIVVKSKGHEHEYGKTDDPNVKIIELDLVNNHFVNGSKVISGNDCLHYAIGDKYPELFNQMTPEQLRNAVANEIHTNNDIKAAISSYDKQFYLEIGLYGGKDPTKNRRGRKKTWVEGQKHGTYYQVSKANTNRKQTNKEVHHIPSSAAQKDTPYGNESRGKQSATLLDKDVHRKLSSTGNSAESQEFVKQQRDLLIKGLRDEALAMDHRDRHNAEIEVRKKRKEQNYEFEESSSTHMNEVYNDMKEQIDTEHKIGKLNEEQRDYVKGEIDKLAANKRTKVNIRDGTPIEGNSTQTNSKNSSNNASNKNRKSPKKEPKREE